MISSLIPLLLLSTPGLAQDTGAAAPIAADAAATLSVDPSIFAASATVDPAACSGCPPGVRQGEGVLQLRVPALLRHPGEDPDGRDLAVLDGAGRPLDVAVVTGAAWGEEAAPGAPAVGDVPVSSRLRATADVDTWLLSIDERPADVLHLDLGASRWAVTVGVDRRVGAVWVPVGEDRLLWALDGTGRSTVELGGLTGELRLRLTRHHPLRGWAPDIDVTARSGPHVPPVTLTLPVQQAVLTESGLVRYTVELPAPLPVRAVTPRVADADVFERSAVVTIDSTLPDEYGPTPDQRLQRIRLGGVEVEELRLPVRTEAGGDTLVLWVDAAGRPPLDIPEVEVELAGMDLLVRDPGPGSLTLLGRGDALPGQAARPPSDLQAAAPELGRMVDAVLPVGPVGPNPAYVPPEHRAALAGPSTPLELRGFSWRARVEAPTPAPAPALANVATHGDTSLVRIPVSDAVLATAAADLHDLRLVVAGADGEARQVPYLLRRRPLDRWQDALAWERNEDGATSRLEVPLPAALGDHTAPVSAVRLRTDAPLFSRQVTLSRVRGAVLDPLRSVRWIGSERPGTLALTVDAPVGDTLVVEVDNGDDPPLPLSSVEVATPVWEIVAWLPPGEVHLYWGDPDRHLPVYDLALLGEELEARASREVVLAAPESVAPAAASTTERGIVLGGLGALAAGLGFLVIGLVREVREEEPPATSEPATSGPAPSASEGGEVGGDA